MPRRWIRIGSRLDHQPCRGATANGVGYSIYLEFEHPGPDHRDAMQVSKDALFLWGYGLGWILNHPNLQGPPRPGGPREAHY